MNHYLHSVKHWKAELYPVMRFALLSTSYALLALTPLVTWANEVDELIKRFQPQATAQFHYQETRHLELANEPVKAEGYLLSDADGNLVKLQTQPQRVVMAITGEHLYYWDAQQKQRHRATLNSDMAAASQIGVFRALIQGRIEQLRGQYDVTSQQQGANWSLSLSPKTDAHTRIELKGDANPKLRYLHIQLADGEATDYRLSLLEPPASNELNLPKLLQEAIGP